MTEMSSMLLAGLSAMCLAVGTSLVGRAEGEPSAVRDWFEGFGVRERGKVVRQIEAAFLPEGQVRITERLAELPGGARLLRTGVRRGPSAGELVPLKPAEVAYGVCYDGRGLYSTSGILEGWQRVGPGKAMPVEAFMPGLSAANDPFLAEVKDLPVAGGEVRRTLDIGGKPVHLVYTLSSDGLILQGARYDGDRLVCRFVNEVVEGYDFRVAVGDEGTAPASVGSEAPAPPRKPVRKPLLQVAIPLGIWVPIGGWFLGE